jgi:hypothetical protein
MEKQIGKNKYPKKNCHITINNTMRRFTMTNKIFMETSKNQ